MSPVAVLQLCVRRIRSLAVLSIGVLLVGAAIATRTLWPSGLESSRDADLTFSGPLPAVASDAGVKQLEERLIERGFTLHDVLENGAAVPRLFLAKVPADLPTLESPVARKEAFVKMLLPLVLAENERILRDRDRLTRLHDAVEGDKTLAQADAVWLMGIADRYNVDYDTDELSEVMEELLERVDAIPPSLAIGQAALETGWGTSSAAQGQAMFGQMVFGDGDRAEVRRFERLAHAVQAYAQNLNTHRAYQRFRDKRLEARGRGEVPSGFALALTLARYSERKMDYVHDVRGIIKANRLQPLDRARLDIRAPQQVAEQS